MGVILDALRTARKQAQDCEEDGTAHKEWEAARQIDEVEFEAVCAMVAAGMSLQLAMRTMYEAGYSASTASLMP